MADRTLADPQPIDIAGLNRRVIRIRWLDGAETVYRASALRAVCPCASCYDPQKGSEPPAVSPAVVAVSMAPVGRYALQISWSDGHTSGIYPFRMLREDCNGRLPSDPYLLDEQEAPAPPPEARKVTPETTMQRILELYPSAQRALFQRFHIGGCQSCGFEPGDTLAEVCRKRNVPEVEQVIQLIYQAGSYDTRLQLEPHTLRAWQTAGEPVELYDVREAEAFATAAISGARRLDEALKQQLKQRPDKDARLVFYCERGIRSLDTAAWFAGHGFTRVRSLQGGFQAWQGHDTGAHHHGE